MNLSSSRLVLVVGLFGFAIVWIVLMGLVTMVFGGGRAVAGAAPIDDGSVQAAITSLDRGEDFEISLSLKVTDQAGQILEGLGEQDIEVYEDGELVHYQHFMPAGKGAIRLGLVLDASRSMNQANKWNEAVRASRALLLMLNEHDRVGLYCINDALYEKNVSERLKIEPLSRLHLLNAWDAIRGTPLNEGTPMLGTMQRGLDSLSKVSGRRAMIVLTDGLDTSDPKELELAKQAVLEKCKEAKVPLYMVNLATGTADEQIMRELAETTGGRYIGVPKPAMLKEVFEEIGRSLQNEYTMTYRSPNPVEDGLKRNVKVYVRSGQVGTQARDSYNVPGVISTGGSQRGGADGSLGLTAMGTVFLALAAGLGLLACVPAVLKRQPVGADEAPAVAATPHAHSATGAVRPRPSAQGQQRRPERL